MRKSPEPVSRIAISAVPKLKPRIPGWARVFVRSEVGSQELYCLRHVRSIDNRASSRRFGHTRRSSPVSAERPHDVIRVFVLITFLERKRLEHEHRKDVGDFHGNIFADAAAVEGLAAQMNDDEIRGSELRSAHPNRRNLRANTFSGVPLETARGAVTYGAKEFQAHCDVVYTALPAKCEFASGVRSRLGLKSLSVRFLCRVR